MANAVKPIIPVYLDYAKTVTLESKQSAHNNFSNDCWEIPSEIADVDIQFSANLATWEQLNFTAAQSIHLMLLRRY
ncbi:hypothetical protein [Fortiea contorta]|uniref:hypothetical protein n=1 Tax=Fortiea contorta TaxID=1892405 RepID=UPI00036D919F|nr:hypothetical protein [Fortiea contorta]